MQNNTKTNFFILGVFIFLGLSSLGYFLTTAVNEYRTYDRTVSVKGLSEKEVKADIVIWPIQYQIATNDINELYEKLENSNSKVEKFLLDNSISKDEITFSTPTIIDRLAQSYSTTNKAEFRYSATQIITVYSQNIDGVRGLKNKLSSLGKEGIVFSGNDYMARTEYIYTKLNDIKPSMIEEATKNARTVAEKFANDSKSKLGKIKTAYQGQFSVSQRDKNNPHIKKIRIVSTIVYYLND